MAKRVTAQQRKILDSMDEVIAEAVRYEHEQCTNKERRVAKKAIAENRKELERLRELEKAVGSGELERLRALVDDLDRQIEMLTVEPVDASPIEESAS